MSGCTTGIRFSWLTLVVHEQGLRDKVDITFVTPLPGAFTKPTCRCAARRYSGAQKCSPRYRFLCEGVDQDAKSVAVV